jgi:hypothetical protein
MAIKDTVSKIAKQEGKKHQAKVGDVREIVGLLSEEMATEPAIVAALIKLGASRIKRKKK